MFGNSAFCEVPFATQEIAIRIVDVTGVQADVSLGSSTITGTATVTLTGNALSVLTGTATAGSIKWTCSGLATFGTSGAADFIPDIAAYLPSTC